MLISDQPFFSNEVALQLWYPSQFFLFYFIERRILYMLLLVALQNNLRQNS